MNCVFFTTFLLREGVLATLLGLEANLLAIALAIAGLLHAYSAGNLTEPSARSLLAREASQKAISRLGVSISLFFFALLLHILVYFAAEVPSFEGAMYFGAFNTTSFFGIALLLVGLAMMYSCRKIFVSEDK